MALQNEVLVFWCMLISRTDMLMSDWLFSIGGVGCWLRFKGEQEIFDHSTKVL